MRPHRWQPTRLPHPWDSPSKNTGVGCHFLLLCMKVKTESEVLQSCLTLSDPMDCSLSGSSIHGIFQARVLEWGAIAFSRINPLGGGHHYPHHRAARTYTGLGKQTLGGHKQNLVCTRTQEKGAVTPQETDPDLPLSVQGSLVEVWVSGSLLQGRGN